MLRQKLVCSLFFCLSSHRMVGRNTERFHVGQTNPPCLSSFSLIILSILLFCLTEFDYVIQLSILNTFSWTCNLQLFWSLCPISLRSTLTMGFCTFFFFQWFWLFAPVLSQLVISLNAWYWRWNIIRDTGYPYPERSQLSLTESETTGQITLTQSEIIEMIFRWDSVLRRRGLFQVP